jgi:GH15 family glucan-1,4-alpha-glucosidase
MSRIAEIHAPGSTARYRQAASALRSRLLSTCVDPQRRTLVAAPGDREVDASLLQAITLGLLGPRSPEAAPTIEAIRSDLEFGGLLQRYRTDDGFGRPSVGFTLCSFWLVEALGRMGRVEEARALMGRIEQIRAPLGLLSEDVDPLTNQMWGNFPQAYSHVGMIHAAFAASPRWSEVV